LDLEQITLAFVSSTSTACDFSGSTVAVWPACGCYDCQTDTGFDQLSVTIDGITGTGPWCAEVNDTWVLNKYTSGQCWWRYSKTLSYGVYMQLDVKLQRIDTSTIRVTGTIYLYSGSDYTTHYFIDDISEVGRLDCCADLDAMALSLSSSTCVRDVAGTVVPYTCICTATYATMTLAPDCP
jgi:hypothetical protein